MIINARTLLIVVLVVVLILALAGPRIGYGPSWYTGSYYGPTGGIGLVLLILIVLLLLGVI